jgi:four helix bundle protein
MVQIKTHKDLRVYQLAFQSALEIHEISKSFPKEERYSLTDQIRRSSRSVCANIAEAYRNRKYKKAFVAKLILCVSEASETITWLDFAISFNYLENEKHTKLIQLYDHIIGKLVNMSRQPEKWSF